MINRGFGLTFDAEREYTEIDLGRWMRATLNAELRRTLERSGSGSA